MISKIYAIIFCLILTGISTGMQVHPNQALLIGIRAGDLAAVIRALNAGADPDCAHGLSSPLIEAGLNSHPHIAELLIMRGATINRRLEFSTTALMRIATRENGAAVARLLLQHQADINAQDNKGATPLMYALYKKEDDTVRLLLEHQADINLLNNDGHTALGVASYLDRDSAVQLLLEAKAGAK